MADKLEVGCRVSSQIEAEIQGATQDTPVFDCACDLVAFLPDRQQNIALLDLR